MERRAVVINALFIKILKYTNFFYFFRKIGAVRCLGEGMHSPVEIGKWGWFSLFFELLEGVGRNSPLSKVGDQNSKLGATI